MIMKPLSNWRDIARVAAIILLISFPTYRYWTDLRDLVLHAEDGRIVLNSPTVYTRQRLVNDRLRQVAWLEDQLKAADGFARSADGMPDFKMIEQVLTKADRAG